ncbi:porin family protein [Flavobacterium nackdongense]|uniref:PorT family protein n=1 Tax=Flavobacterium nackdongense TaxID=2547394 RepID=A0A4P6YAD8_9FLAO|nr:porin family protein [Flavobacterium nackdongense]QBN17694.1 PorT family protein [Flavobacterium nackdongense]
MKKFLLVFTFLLSIQSMNSQVLISLVFGDMLNSPKVEFGLEGGVNFSTISNLENSKGRTDFNLGFYFDFMLKNPSWAVNTGVIVKSTLGANGLPVYSLNNTELDNAFVDGHVDRKINYFHVPIMMKYKFDNHIYVKAGTQLGLLGKATDEFKNDFDGNELEYKNNIRDKIHVIDAGLAIGAGYRLMGGHGMNIGFNYYYGLVTVMKGDANPNQYHRSFYITAGIPIGKGKAEKRALEKSKNTNAN